MLWRCDWSSYRIWSRRRCPQTVGAAAAPVTSPICSPRRRSASCPTSTSTRRWLVCASRHFWRRRHHGRTTRRRQKQQLSAATTANRPVDTTTSAIASTTFTVSANDTGRTRRQARSGTDQPDATHTSAGPATSAGRQQQQQRRRHSVVERWTEILVSVTAINICHRHQRHHHVNCCVRATLAFARFLAFSITHIQHLPHDSWLSFKCFAYE